MPMWKDSKTDSTLPSRTDTMMKMWRDTDSEDKSPLPFMQCNRLQLWPALPRLPWTRMDTIPTHNFRDRQNDTHQPKGGFLLTVTGYIRGHQWIQTLLGKRWSESGQRIRDNVPCKRCGEYPVMDGPDPCLGMLPGVRAACCGHGAEPGYIMFRNGLVIRGYFKVEKDEED